MPVHAPRYGQAGRHKQNRSCAHRVCAMRRGEGRQARVEKVPLPGEVVVEDGVGRRDKNIQLDAQHAGHQVAVPSRLHGDAATVGRSLASNDVDSAHDLQHALQ